MRYFQKEIPESGVIINGVTMRFDLLETEDAILINELDKCISRGVGGVMPISKEQYDEEVKKKALGLSSPDSLNRPRQRQELSANQLSNLHAAVGGDRFNNANGQFARPQLGREHSPQNGFGLPRGNTPTPDPIHVPSSNEFESIFSRPPTARMSEVKGAT